MFFRAETTIYFYKTHVIGYHNTETSHLIGGAKVLTFLFQVTKHLAVVSI